MSVHKRQSDLTTRVVVGVVVAGLAYVLWMSLVGRTHYYDTFDYLNDARRLAGDDEASYYRVHAPLVPLLLTPFAGAIRSTEDGGHAIRWILPNLLAFALALSMLVACYRWFRHPMRWRHAALGVALVVGSRLFVRYAPHLLVDVATATFVALAFWAWSRTYRSRPRLRDYALLGLALGGGMLTKYSLLILPAVFVAAEVTRSALERRLRLSRLAGISVAISVAGVTFWIVMSAIFGYLDGRPLTAETLRAVFNESQGMVTRLEGEGPPVLEYPLLLLRSVSPLVVVLALIGGVANWRRWRRDLPVWLWSLLLPIALCERVPRSQVRYLWPIVPTLAYLAALGAIEVQGWLPRAKPGSGTLVRTLASTLTILALVAPGFDQARRDAGPFSRANTQPQLTRFIQHHAGSGGRVFWAGSPMVVALTAPLEPLPEDEYFNFFHFSHPGVHYMTGARFVGVPLSDPRRYLLNQGEEGDVFFESTPHWFDSAVLRREDVELPTHYRAFALVQTSLHIEQNRIVARADGRLPFRDEGEALFFSGRCVFAEIRFGQRRVWRGWTQGRVPLAQRPASDQRITLRYLEERRFRAIW